MGEIKREHPKCVTEHLRESWRFGSALLLTASAATCPTTAAQDEIALDPDDFRVSYIYAAIMGTGTYKIDGRRITMLRMPFELTRREAEEDRPGLTWHAAVSIGYDAVTDNNWLERIFEDDLVTLSAVPGFELQIPLNDTWTIKPLGNLGLMQDFTDGESIVMGVLGARGLATWREPQDWELRWGLGLRLAGEYQLESKDTEGFTVLETGLDYRRDTDYQILGHSIIAGTYVRYQRFVPVFEITSTPIGDSEIMSLVELGLSVGVKRPHKILGFRLDQVRVGYQRGDGFTGWTLGGQFPF